MIEHERLLSLVNQFSGKRVLVLGDMVADEYIYGAPLKISREAPVLVLRWRDSSLAPGGALNPAVNARTLGAEVYLAGVVGDDEPGRRLRERLADLGINMDGLFSEPGRPTSTKTRVLAGDTQLRQQQIVRIDQIDTSELEIETQRDIIAYLNGMIPQVDALIISDYENGVINPHVLQSALPLARALGKTVVADSHGDLARFQGVTALTPNQPEAEAMLGWEITNIASLERAGARLLELAGVEAVLITRGSEGMSLFTQDSPPFHLPASTRSDVADPTGAGDTVAATFTLAVAATPRGRATRFRDAATLANLAAGLVVRRFGCATNTPAELAAAICAKDGDHHTPVNDGGQQAPVNDEDQQTPVMESATHDG
ncbi:MAG TPA: bifunctional ADP-heptose synthase [Ktedonobacterales bacterium]|nr:bifunctional ADP-heptose synthase [Ktedonobacterales bacterium]